MQYHSSQTSHTTNCSSDVDPTNATLNFFLTKNTKALLKAVLIEALALATTVTTFPSQSLPI